VVRSRYLSHLSFFNALLKQERHFAKEVFRRDPTDSMAGRVTLPEEVEGENYVHWVKMWTWHECARIYPTAWLDQVGMIANLVWNETHANILPQWIERLPFEDRKDPQRVERHLRSLNNASIGLMLSRTNHHSFSRYTWGFEVKVRIQS
jgi:hypothetical protein